MGKIISCIWALCELLASGQVARRKKKSDTSVYLLYKVEKAIGNAEKIRAAKKETQRYQYVDKHYFCLKIFKG